MKLGNTPTRQTNFKILIEIQHFGGKTNLIDFTTDYYVALFFAASGFPGKDGRVILQDRNGNIKDWVRELPDQEQGSRPDVQKSIFVQSPEGFIPDDFIKSDTIITIPKDLKLPLLKYLQRQEIGISAESIYHDTHGFIRSQGSRWSAYPELMKGGKFQDSGDETAHAEEKAKHYQMAVAHFTNAINRMHPSAEIYYNRGLSHHRLGKFDHAIQDYNTAIELQPDFAFAYHNRGLAYDQAGEFDLAIQDYNMAVKLKPDGSEAYNNRGSAYASKNDYNQAIENYTRAIKLNSDDPETYNNRGSVHLRNGEVDQAIDDFNTAINLKQSYLIAYYNRGLAYHRKGRYNLALEDLTTATQLDANDVDTYQSRGMAHGMKRGV